MDAFIGHKQIGGPNECRRPMVAGIVIAQLIGIFVSSAHHVCAATPNEPVKISATSSTESEELSQRIKQLVKQLEYSDVVAKDFANMVLTWKDEQGEPVLIVWKKKLYRADEDHQQGRKSEDQLVKIKESIVRELGQRVRREISYNQKFFELIDVIKKRQTQCLGYSQILYILGNSIGLSVKVIDVVEPITLDSIPAGLGHIANIVSLINGNTMVVDLTLTIQGKPIIKNPFQLEREFKQVGNYWELKNQENPLKIHKKFQLLDQNGIVGTIYSNRGAVHAKSGQYKQAISDCIKAIELNPRYADAYSNRGNAYSKLGQLPQAISDHTRAIELNPKLSEAYYNRGNDYDELGQLPQAISDYTKAIELNPKFAEAYYNRGVAYDDLGQLTQAISDYSKAIELNPKYAEAYSNRGVTYRKLGQDTQAISDYTKAIELNPKFAEAYNNRGVIYGKLGQHTQAISDYTKAIELNPKYDKAYCSRGVAYAALGKPEEAKKDLLKVVELDPASKALVKRISDHFKLDLRLD
jgi:tetratricopeptide (TPR) repeat protein